MNGNRMPLFNVSGVLAVMDSVECAKDEVVVRATDGSVFFVLEEDLQGITRHKAQEDSSTEEAPKGTKKTKKKAEPKGGKGGQKRKKNNHGNEKKSHASSKKAKMGGQKDAAAAIAKSATANDSSNMFAAGDSPEAIIHVSVPEDDVGTEKSQDATAASKRKFFRYEGGLLRIKKEPATVGSAGAGDDNELTDAEKGSLASIVFLAGKGKLNI